MVLLWLYVQTKIKTYNSYNFTQLLPKIMVVFREVVLIFKY